MTLNEKELLAKLFSIASKQQLVLEKLAQMPATPMANQAPPSDDLSAKLQQAVMSLLPNAASLFVEMPVVKQGGVSGGKHIVFYKYHASKGDANLKSAVVSAANAVLGQNNYTIQSTGEF